MIQRPGPDTTEEKKKISTSIKLWLLCLSLVFLTALLNETASAVTSKEVLRVQQNQRFQGLFGFSWLESVHVTEPSTIAPVIVTWSTDYQATGVFLAGLSVNGGPCTLYGPAWFQPFGKADGSGPFESNYLQWIVLPTDGLVKGMNTFTLCGGGFFSPSDIILLGANTLTVRTTK